MAVYQLASQSFFSIMLGPLDFGNRLSSANCEHAFREFDKLSPYQLPQAYYPLPFHPFNSQPMVPRQSMPLAFQPTQPGPELAQRLFTSMLHPYSIPEDLISRLLPTPREHQWTPIHQEHDEEALASPKTPNATYSAICSSTPFAKTPSTEIQESTFGPLNYYYNCICKRRVVSQLLWLAV